MAGNFVTNEGFVGRSFEENKNFYESEFKRIFGNDIDLSPQGAIGQLVLLFALNDTQHFELAEEIYNSRDPNMAIGASLDAICAITGIIRRQEAPTVIPSVLFQGSIGSVIPAGTQVRQGTGEFSSNIYETLEEVVVSRDKVRYVELKVDTDSRTAASAAVGLFINGEQISVRKDNNSNETLAELLGNLIRSTSPGGFNGNVSFSGDTIILESNLSDFSYSTVLSTVNDYHLTVKTAIDCQGLVTGDIEAPAGTIDTIVTPVSGITGVENPVNGTVGTHHEIDSLLRIRRRQSLFAANGTEQAILAGVLNNVTGIRSISISSNRTSVQNSKGLAPHSFELVVSGGNDRDIAQAIFNAQPAGIESFGTLAPILINDSEGTPQPIRFSRPTPVFLHIEIRRSLYSEEEYPTTGDDLIKQAIVDWSIEGLPIGKDVIRQRLISPIYSIDGIEDVQVRIARTVSATGTPVYRNDNIAIANREFADVDTDRIQVLDM